MLSLVNQDATATKTSTTTEAEAEALETNNNNLREEFGAGKAGKSSRGGKDFSGGLKVGGADCSCNFCFVDCASRL